ncbi:acyl-CoA carboxylase epsilon subunit [Streptomyces sp. NPDC048340]|uniref:acyl-CoA carboxylase epsilon subunit n=1 Tax=Streptomyces sp. NPDC048340 TaxID=3365537 RepID=UPI003714D28D
MTAAEGAGAPEQGAGQAVAQVPAAAGEPWRITGGHPDAAETAAVMAVLTALLSRSEDPGTEQQRTVASGWDRTRNSEFRHAGSWRRPA